MSEQPTWHAEYDRLATLVQEVKRTAFESGMNVGMGKGAASFTESDAAFSECLRELVDVARRLNGEPR